jgi:putative toxin-antitoxin system antitoxin component (TIGR02293 family)
MFWIISTFVLSAIIIFQEIRWRMIIRFTRQLHDNRYIGEILKRGVEVFEDEEAFRRWLYGSIQALNYRRPIDVLREANGKDKVLAILGRIEHGVYS